jgi:hypothetical protein
LPTTTKKHLAFFILFFPLFFIAVCISAFYNLTSFPYVKLFEKVGETKRKA